MATIYTAPGVYLEKVEKINRATGVAGGFLGAFIGVAQRGEVKKPVLVNSWNEYIEKFALGMNSPYLPDSLLAHSVYGFFQNGGTRCYIVRAAGAGAAKATLTIPTATGVINAKDEGVWGNNLKVAITANGEAFDLTIKLNGEIVEEYVALSADETSGKYWAKHLNDNSQYVTAVAGTIVAMAETALATGSDGAAVSDSSFAGAADSAVNAFNSVQFNDVVGIAIPGRSSTTVCKALVEYVATRKNMFAVLDPVETASPADVKTFRSNFDSNISGVYSPWGKIVNPLSPVGALMNCPPSGHIIGVFANFFASIGPWRAPAGTSATVRGFVDLARHYTESEIGDLNNNNVNTIVAKPNYGIVVWGARTLTTQGAEDLFYVSDALLNLYIKQSIYNLTLPFVFEPNGESTWNQIAATVEAFLNPIWANGGLKGENAEDAYFVRCDETTNTEATIKQGKLICEVGYAANRPAEFIIFRISHDITQS